MKTKLLITLFFLGFVSNLTAFEVKKSSLYYLKLGASNPPGNSGVLPTLGIGARFQKNAWGLDLSGNLNSLILINYISLKGSFLYYPFPKKRNQFYIGMGPGIGYHVSSIPMGQPYGATSNQHGSLTVEGIMGYEFRHSALFKTFIQLEVSQPVLNFGEREKCQNYKPGLAISVGLGF